MPTQETWLKCKIDSGMFSDEFSIEIENNEGKKLSFFTTEEFIKKTLGESLVKVQVISENKISLPTETFETGTSAVNVPSQNLRFR